MKTGVRTNLLAVDEEDQEYEYDSADDEQQDKRSVGEDDLPVVEEGEKRVTQIATGRKSGIQSVSQFAQYQEP